MSRSPSSSARSRRARKRSIWPRLLRRDRVPARAEARPHAAERVLRLATLLCPRAEEDHRGREERDYAPCPDAGDEKDDRPDDECAADDQEGIRGPKGWRRRAYFRFTFDCEGPPAFGAEAAPIRGRMPAVSAVRQERPPSPPGQGPEAPPGRARASRPPPPCAGPRPRPRSRRPRSCPCGGRTRAP